MAILKEVRCNWASVIEPNRHKEYGDKWEIEAELNDEQAAMFADAGVRLKENDDGIKLVRISRKTTGNKRAGGTFDKVAPTVVDAKRQPFSKLIGNGSLVNIAFDFIKWEMMGTTGTKADLKAVQVLELVEYGGGDTDEFEDAGDTTVIGSADKEENIDDIF